MDIIIKNRKVTVLCYGDSNTWGTIPQHSRRYCANERWPALLNNLLSHVEVIEEGQQGRTIIYNPPFAGNKNGQRYLKDCLDTYTPDLVLILLGTNDLKKRFSLCAAQIAEKAAGLAQQTQEYMAFSTNKAAKVLLICPPPIYEVGLYATMYEGGAEKSLLLAKYYAKYATEVGCDFFDAGSVISSCEAEGIHWQANQHKILAETLASLVTDILSN